MVVVEYHKVELDYCPECGGTWFDQGEINLLLRSMELEGSAAFLDQIVKQPRARTDETVRKCPICNRSMQKHYIGGTPKVMVDVCPLEDGIWFDSGEVRRLLSSLGADKSKEYGSQQELVAFLGEVFETEEVPRNGGSK